MTLTADNIETQQRKHSSYIENTFNTDFLQRSSWNSKFFYNSKTLYITF